jgi:hypothetical protein
MLKRTVCILVAAGAVFVASACDDGDTGYYGSGYGSASPSSSVVCGDNKTCGTCTPVYGCGWCATGNGTGTCADGPNNCSTAPAGWTWDPVGCTDLEGGVALDGSRTVAEAGIGSGDTDGSTGDNDAGTDAGNTGPADAADGG